MATILIVEDDKNTRLLTSARLSPRYDIITATNGEEGMQILFSRHIDLIVADVMMPIMDGYTMLKSIRKQNIDIPILLLTARQGFEDKRQGFSLGTDDYMTKPVDFEELIWRVDALLRRNKIAAERRIVFGKTTVDALAYTVTQGETNVELPKKEFELLYKLLSYPGQIFTRFHLLDEIWGYDSESGEDTVKVHINRLRNRFSKNTDFEIVTIRGLGYKAEIKTK